MESFTMTLSNYPIKFLDEDIVTKPAYQREIVWNPAKKKGLIDTILRGLPMQPIVLVIENTIFGDKRMILDGQQRYAAIVEYKKCMFQTGNLRNASKRTLPPVYPGLSYDQLPEEAISRFDNYNLPVIELRNLGGDEQGELFRRLQIQEPLKQGEVLFSMNSDAVTVLSEIMQHRYFGDFYTKQTKRKEQFQIAIIFLCLEKTYHNKQSIYLNLTTDNKAKETKNITLRDSAYVKNILSRLENIIYLYKGAFYTSIAESIMLYQSVLLFDEFNVNIKSCPEGMLCNWFLKLHNQFSNGKYAMRDRDEFSIYQLDLTNRQMKFWANNLDEMLSQDGIVIKDRKRIFSKVQKIEAYISQDGKCANCGKHFVGIENSVADHIVPHACGGKTDIDNCQLLCKDCHAIKHGFMEAN